MVDIDDLHEVVEVEGSAQVVKANDCDILQGP